MTRTRVVTMLVVVALIGAACTSHKVGGSGSGTTAPTVSPSIKLVDAGKQTCSAPVTSTCLGVGNVSTISGIVPGLFEGAAVGTDAYLSYIDSTQGGINGRKIAYYSADDKFSGNSNSAETQALISKVIAFAGSFSLQDQDGGLILQKNPNVANVSVSLSLFTNSLANTFSVNPLSNGSALGALMYFKQNYPSATQHVGLMIAQESSAEAAGAGLRAAMEHLGYHISYSALYGPLNTNFTTNILAMQHDGVQFVDLSNTDAANAEHMVQEMYQQGYHPQVIESNGAIYVDNFVQLAGGPQAANGIWLPQGAALYLGGDAQSVPAVDTFLEWVNKVHPGFTPDLFTLYGWASAELLVQAIKAAATPLSQSTVLDALKQITNFDASGLMSPANPAGKVPGTCYVMARIVNGKFVRVPPSPKSGFICGASYYHPPK